jgi:hypothetical protein
MDMIFRSLEFEGAQRPYRSKCSSTEAPRDDMAEVLAASLFWDRQSKTSAELADRQIMVAD